jgi:hypothetical protein
MADSEASCAPSREEAPPESVSASPVARRNSLGSLILKALVCVAMLPLLGFIGLTGRSLWKEYSALQREQRRERKSTVVGYMSINPRPSYAQRPENWFHHEGGETRLWAGWQEQEHQWFTFPRGQVEENPFSLPLGRDVIQVIDRPIFEQEGGAHWVKVQDESLVAGTAVGSTPRAYPLQVLDKVEVINDVLVGLVTYTPVVHEVTIYDPRLGDERVTMGHSGYFIGHAPVLYDRATESLWVPRGETLDAIAGRKKGHQLRRTSKVELVAWSDWKGSNPSGQLLVGADRSGAR